MRLLDRLAAHLHTAQGYPWEAPGFSTSLIRSEKLPSPCPLAKNLPAVEEKYIQIPLGHLKDYIISEVKILHDAVLLGATPRERGQ